MKKNRFSSRFQDMPDDNGRRSTPPPHQTKYAQGAPKGQRKSSPLQRYQKSQKKTHERGYRGYRRA